MNTEHEIAAAIFVGLRTEPRSDYNPNRGGDAELAKEALDAAKAFLDCENQGTDGDGPQARAANLRS